MTCSLIALDSKNDYRLAFNREISGAPYFIQSPAQLLGNYESLCELC